MAARRPSGCWSSGATGRRRPLSDLVAVGAHAAGPAARPVHAGRPDGTRRRRWSSGPWATRTSPCGCTPWAWPNAGWRDDAGLLAPVAALGRRPHPRVRLQAALTLGESAIAGRCRGAGRIGRCQRRRHAGCRPRSSVPRRNRRPTCWSSYCVAPTTGTSAVAGAAAGLDRRAPASQRRTRPRAGGGRDGQGPGGGRAAVGQPVGIDRGAETRQAGMLTTRRGRARCAALLASSDGEVRAVGVSGGGLVRLAGAPEMKAALESAAKTALDESRPLADAWRPWPCGRAPPSTNSRRCAERLLDPRQPLDLQLAAVAAWRPSRTASGRLLLQDWFDATRPRCKRRPSTRSSAAEPAAGPAGRAAAGRRAAVQPGPPAACSCWRTRTRRSAAGPASCWPLRASRRTGRRSWPGTRTR